MLVSLNASSHRTYIYISIPHNSYSYLLKTGSYIRCIYKTSNDIYTSNGIQCFMMICYIIILNFVMFRHFYLIKFITAKWEHRVWVNNINSDASSLRGFSVIYWLIIVILITIYASKREIIIFSIISLRGGCVYVKIWQ